MFNLNITNFASNLAEVPLAPESRETKTKWTNYNKSRPKPWSRRLKISSNFQQGHWWTEVCYCQYKNTSRSIKQWMNVSKSWTGVHFRHLENNNIKLVPEGLDKVLGQFYAEVKRKDEEDYELESLRIMQSSIEHYFKEKDYPQVPYERRSFTTQKKSSTRRQ